MTGRPLACVFFFDSKVESNLYNIYNYRKIGLSGKGDSGDAVEIHKCTVYKYAWFGNIVSELISAAQLLLL